MNPPASITVELPPSAHAELGLFSLGLADALGHAGHEVDLRVSERAGSPECRIYGPGVRQPLQISVRDRVLSLRCADGREMELAPALPPWRRRRGSSTTARRFLFAGDREFTRRLRMTARTLSELRRRRIDSETIVVGEVPSDMLKIAAPDHQWKDLEGEELERLLHASTAVLEAVDDGEPRTLLSGLAHSIELPVVIHASAAVDGMMAVNEWSADAFCDALIEARADSTPSAAFEQSWALVRKELFGVSV